MFSNIANFFINNSKLTLVIVLIFFIAGISSYIALPKQYNPEIIVPAFQVSVTTNGLNSDEVLKYITTPLENKIMELEGIDEVYGYTKENFSGVMAKFHVGINKEDAKIRLNQKLLENLDLKPLGVSDPIIKTIDPDELPQITYAIYNKDENNLSEQENYIHLRQIAKKLEEEIKIVKNVASIEIVGGLKKDIIVNLDLDKIEASNLSLSAVKNSILNSNSNFTAGDIVLDSGEKIQVSINSKNNTIDELGKIKITNNFNKNIYLSDISTIKYGTNRLDRLSNIYINGTNHSSVFVGFGKTKGTNAITVTSDIEESIQKIKNTLPKNIEIIEVDNQGKTAKNATNMLMTNLFQSIIIVVIILSLSLGFKNALNTAISIPLTLFSVFTIALIIGENINRITLFALILVLGMLVDDSTVVVENINRHLESRFKDNKTKLEAIITAIKEVELGVVLSTVTRLLAFGAMFFVGDMMGEYMGPIPKFALMASVISTIVALSINPWISFHMNKDTKETKKIKNKKKFSIRKYYLMFMKLFIGEGSLYKKRRKLFKITFWISLFIVIIAPIYLGIFKARMLPKSNQNQVYLWIDAPVSWSAEKTNKVSTSVKQFLSKQTEVKSISTTIGQAFIGDFANMFRGGANRSSENQISSRINLFSSSEYKSLYSEERSSSEQFVIKINSKLRESIKSKFPDVKLRLLEDPPGPPVRSTFRAKIKSNSSDKELYYFAQLVENEVKKIGAEKDLIDIENNFPSTYKKIVLTIDKENLSKSGLNLKQVQEELTTILSGEKIQLYTQENSFEPTYILIGVDEKSKNSKTILNKINLINNIGKQVPLSSIVSKTESFINSSIETDNRKKTLVIMSEVGDNSLIYPQIALFKKLMNKNFLKNNYKISSWNPYKIEFISLSTGKEFIIEWGGEWKLTIDTFRDLGIAMIVALLGIYLLLVGQFRSFGVAGIIMITFLLGFFGVFLGFSFLYLFKNEYFSATSMIGIIALGGIVVGNAIILIEYINILKNKGLALKDALLKAGYTRFKPIILTSLTTVFGAATIVGDPVWSGLARAIIWGLLLSSILTLIVIPIFYYDSQKKYW